MSRRSDRLYCRDILESGAAIRSYVEGLDFAAFVKDRMRYSAVIREFEIIGEAARLGIFSLPTIQHWAQSPTGHNIIKESMRQKRRILRMTRFCTDIFPPAAGFKWDIFDSRTKASSDFLPYGSEQAG
jgi:hypothetical protein